MSAASAHSLAPPAPARRTRRSARTRERIVQAAVEVFARRGFHGARVADIADAAGIAYGLVYHHFKNKDEILAAIFTERWASYTAYLAEVSASDVTFNEKLAGLVHFWVEAYRDDPHLMTVMINEISRSYEFLESHDVGAVLVAFDAVAELVEEARRRGEVRDDVDAQMASYIVLGAAEMILTGYVMGTLRREGREAFARDEHQLVAFLVGGLSPG